MHANCAGMYQNRRILLYFWAMILFRMKMKRLSVHILPALVLAAVLSCEKNPQPVTPPDKPVDPNPPTPAQVVDYDKYQLKELAAKAGIKLGVAFTYGEYSSTVEAILKKDFAAVTFGNEMKHDAIVSQSGTYVFDRADKMAGWARSCGNELFGHTLGWHSQQQRTYLNKLIANAAPNNKASLLRENWNFETGTLNGFVADEFEVFSDLYDVFAGDYAAKAVNDRATLQIDVPIEEERPIRSPSGRNPSLVLPWRATWVSSPATDRERWRSSPLSGTSSSSPSPPRPSGSSPIGSSRRRTSSSTISVSSTSMASLPATMRRNRWSSTLKAIPPAARGN